MSKRVTIRIPDELHARLIAQAKTDQRTLSNLVILLLNQGMNVARNVADSTEGKKGEGV